MNAEAITNDLLADIEHHLYQGIGDAQRTRIRYAISRSVGSIISGLTPIADDPVAITEPPTETGVPPVMRRELVRAAIQLGCSYYYLCSIYKQGYADAGSAGKGKPAELPETACNGRGVPMEQYTEGAPRQDAASQPLKAEIARLEKEVAEAREGFKAMKAERDAFAATNVALATHNEALKKKIGELLPPTETERAVIKEISRRLMA